MENKVTLIATIATALATVLTCILSYWKFLRSKHNYSAHLHMLFTDCMATFYDQRETLINLCGENGNSTLDKVVAPYVERLLSNKLQKLHEAESIMQEHWEGLPEDEICKLRHFIDSLSGYYRMVDKILADFNDINSEAILFQNYKDSLKKTIPYETKKNLNVASDDHFEVIFQKYIANIDKQWGVVTQILRSVRGPKPTF